MTRPKKVWECQVDLRINPNNVQWTLVSGGQQPSFGYLDAETVPKAVLASAEVREALEARGINDLDRVQVDIWPVGRFSYGEMDF